MVIKEVTISNYKKQQVQSLNLLVDLALKLSDPMTNAKTYWSFLKTFYNGKKVPIIPPLVINNEIISDFEAKTNHLNNFLRLNVHL